ncbi:MAG: hypothetical protein ACQEQC_08650 [Elusimicrobiota bacterium]
MKKMIRNLVIILLFITPLISCSEGENANSTNKDSFIKSEHFPENWPIVKQVHVPLENLPDFEKKLEGEIIDLKNYILAADGTRLQINVIQSSNKKEAVKIYEKLKEIRGTEKFCLLKGTRVIEFVCDDIAVIAKAKNLLSSI